MGYEIDFLETYDRHSLIRELKRIASVTGRNRVMASDFKEHGRVSFHTILEKFGTIAKANEAAGLSPSPFRPRSDRELLQILADLWSLTWKEKRSRPMKADLRKYGFPVNGCTITKRFGSWNKALLAANELVDNPEQGRSKASRRRTPVSDRVRFLVFKRDLYQCRICRKMGGELELDHMIPVARGGSNEIENLQTLCMSCNRGKRDSLQ